MDVLAGITRVVRADAGTFAASFLEPPWGLRFVDQSPLSIEIVVRGAAWLRPDDGAPRELRTGDIGLINNGTPYVLADCPGTRPGAIIYGPGRSAAADEPAERAADRWRLPVPRSYGRRIDAPTVIIRGTYRSNTPNARRLLAALPSTARIPADRLPGALTQLLQEEVTRVDAAGHDLVLDRLLDLLLTLALRAWLQDPGLRLPAWYRALDHPAIGPALNAIHAQPARSWTVADLARLAGLSRASFAALFQSTVGQPPVAYLTALRIELAASRLRDTDDTLAAIARSVGYSDGYALSTAFKRMTGSTPSAYRNAPA